MITLEQRISNLEILINNLVSNIKSDIRVALPAKVTSFDPVKQTISCIPTIRELVNINGEVSYRDLPELLDVPISTPRGGNWVITMPIKAGDECMVIFQDLCIDGWWFRGDIQNWNDLRRHDLSDAIAIFSPWSQPNTIPSYNTEAMEIRSIDGSTKMTFTPGKVTLIGSLDVNGDVTSTGTVTGKTEVIAKTIAMSPHTHQYVPGTGSPTDTGAPK
jgi:hypothetical protein